MTVKPRPLRRPRRVRRPTVAETRRAYERRPALLAIHPRDQAQAHVHEYEEPWPTPLPARC